MRLLVFGNSSSGKSTLARAVAERDGTPCLDLDTIVWEPGQVAVRRSQAAVAASLDAFLATHERWVIEGCYGDLVASTAPRCTHMLFLDPGLETCLAHGFARPWEPHKYASKQAQDAMLHTLQAWVAGYYARADDLSHRRHREVFEAFAGPKLRLTEPARGDALQAIGAWSGAGRPAARSGAAS